MNNELFGMREMMFVVYRNVIIFMGAYEVKKSGDIIICCCTTPRCQQCDGIDLDEQFHSRDTPSDDNL